MTSLQASWIPGNNSMTQDGATILRERFASSADRIFYVTEDGRHLTYRAFWDASCALADEWEKTVTRMVGNGAQLTDAEKSVLVEYLAENYGP